MFRRTELVVRLGRLELDSTTLGQLACTGHPGTLALSDPFGWGMPIAPLTLATGAGSTAAVADANVGNLPGYYSSVAAFNSGSTANTFITLEVVVYDTAGGSYAAAAYRMHSAPFTMPTAAATAGNFPSTGTFMPGTLEVIALPEPSTLALAGLGVCLWMAWVRRKNF